MKTLHVNNFSGGINNYVSPKSIPDGQMTVLRNGIGDGVCLRPAKAPISLGVYTLEAMGHYGWKNRSVAKWYGRWYWSINDAVTAPYYGGNSEIPGIPYPTTPPAVALVEVSTPLALSANAALSQANIVLASVTGLVAGDYIKIYDNNNSEYAYIAAIVSGTVTLKANLINSYTTAAAANVQKIAGLTGTYQYCVTYLNASLWESAPGSEAVQWWTTKTFVNQNAAVTLPATVPAGIAFMRLYRSTDQGNSFYLLGQYAAGEVGTVIPDSIADIDLVLNIPLETVNLLPPPNGGKYLTERDGVFFLAVNDRLYISAQSNPNAWNPANWIGFDGYDITGITKEYNGILVFTANRTFRVTGSDITTLAKQEIPGQQGCVNYRTVGTAGNVPAWVSNDGICVWDGNKIEIVSKLRYVWTGDAVHAVSANDRYYLFLSSGVIAIFDYRSGGVFREMEMSELPVYGWYDPNFDRFCLADSQTTSDIRVFESGVNYSLTYKSGIMPADGMVQKRFRRILVDAAGAVTVKITSDTGRTLIVSLLGSGRMSGFFPSGFYGRGVSVQLQSSHEIYSYVIEYEEIGI